VHITYAFLIPIVIVSSVAYRIFPLEFFIAVVSGSAASYLLQIYLHTHYHLSESWLLRYPWFRQLKELHRIHHIYPDKNYGLINFYFDRVSGNFLKGKSIERFCLNLKPSSDIETR
jgi:sterol desaturase/sphingolipid hydroxylase (fatty acid hydroxylase superfamily)